MNEHDSESWRPCRAGELAEVAKSLVALRRRRLALQTVGGLCSVFLVIGIVLWLGPASSLPVYASITCSECRNRMPAYRSHSLSTSQRRMMDAHFKHCDGCKDRYDAQTREQSNCDNPADCEQGNCNLLENCKAMESRQASNCMSWRCQVLTCKALEPDKPFPCNGRAKSISPPCDRQPL
ncbi:zf-HC2 domain-containing protein [Blastopirellula sp. J2-11]|uniref:zf-HC2 domain-containing protein n=1 Tax=Blastopirellula sp. J2-11 TaxID=2943192 RepID=UPI0021C6A812|nr:zf-HC2 domain-containing protein [Blastopirellula sp. J2-11]UUO05659.1 zf-HC2 domain-containing protein [Blastopirellula sp. J2-11]